MFATYPITMFDEFGANYFVSEASALCWVPGKIPHKFEIEGYGVFIYQDRDEQAFYYKSADEVHICIYND